MTNKNSYFAVESPNGEKSAFATILDDLLRLRSTIMGDKSL